MVTRLAPLFAGFVLAGCVTAAPANESGMCHAGMPAKSNEAGPAAASADMMKNCTMMKEMATPAPLKDGSHGEGQDRQH